MLTKLNAENFESIVNKEKGLFVIKFFSPTCGPCKTMTPVFEKLALSKDNEDIGFYEVDTMESPELAAHFNVRGVPYMVFCENREVLYEFTGLTPLGNLQYVINNINDPYFREHGQFKQQQGPKKTWIFEISIAVIFLGLVLAIIFL